MPRPEQQEIPGTELPKIPAIEKAARACVNVRDERMALAVKEVAAKTKLIAAMQENADQVSRDGEGDLVYTYDDQQVIVTDKVNVKVKTASADDELG